MEALWVNAFGPHQDIVLSSRARVARNFLDIPFPGAMDDAQAEKVQTLVQESMQHCSGLRLIYQRMANVDPAERAALMEYHLISPEFLQAPYGALLRSMDGQWSIMVNEEDHLRAQCIMPGWQPEKVGKEIARLDGAMQQHANFAYDKQWGYLTACPTNVGTGLRVSVMVHLPALTMAGYMERLKDTVSTLGLALRGMYGEGSKALGYVYQISNQVTMGISWEEIVHNVKNVSREILGKERACRLAMVSDGEKKRAWDDRVHRAVGILRYARNMDMAECMRLWSDAKLGVGMGLLRGIEQVNLHRLLVETQPFALQFLVGKELDSAQRSVERANLCRKTLGK